MNASELLIGTDKALAEAERKSRVALLAVSLLAETTPPDYSVTGDHGLAKVDAYADGCTLVCVSYSRFFKRDKWSFHSVEELGRVLDRARRRDLQGLPGLLGKLNSDILQCCEKIMEQWKADSR